MTKQKNDTFAKKKIEKELQETKMKYKTVLAENQRYKLKLQGEEVLMEQLI